MELSLKELFELEQKVVLVIENVGKTIKDEWNKTKDIQFKEAQERVTKFDIQIEELLRHQLTLLLPNAGFYVEEGGSTEEKEYMWSIDPIDGTNNFIGRIPLFFTQVALVHKAKPIIGVMYSSATGQLFTASQGNGARVNGVKSSHQTVTEISKALVDTDFGGNNGDLDWKLAIVKRLAEKCNRIRASGGLYGPYIAFGGIDVFVVLNEKTKIVDQMPRIIWARELGLDVEYMVIEKHKIMIITNSTLMPDIKSIINS